MSLNVLDNKLLEVHALINETLRRNPRQIPKELKEEVEDVAKKISHLHLSIEKAGN